MKLSTVSTDGVERLQDDSLASFSFLKTKPSALTIVSLFSSRTTLHNSSDIRGRRYSLGVFVSKLLNSRRLTPKRSMLDKVITNKRKKIVPQVLRGHVKQEISKTMADLSTK